MRIWSLHPKYLDTKGLVALWRETLLAKHVLEGKTKGYKNHPQLFRFKNSEKPLDAINQYLSSVYEEAVRREYHFDIRKFNRPRKPVQLSVTQGQFDYELKHLMKKLKLRDSKLFRELKKIKPTEPHPLFTIIEGTIEQWEVGAD